MEIDGATVVVVDAAQVEDQLAIGVDPHIVIALELEDHVLAVDLAILRHEERRSHGHAEVIVVAFIELVAGGTAITRCPVAQRVERHERAGVTGKLTISVEAGETATVVQVELVLGRVVVREVVRAVVVVIAIGILTEQAIHIRALERDTIGIISRIGVEQVLQRAVARVTQHRIAISTGQIARDDTLTDTTIGTGPIVVIVVTVVARITSAEREWMLVAMTLPRAIVVIDITGLAVDHIVIKQIHMNLAIGARHIRNDLGNTGTSHARIRRRRRSNLLGDIRGCRHVVVFRGILLRG